MMRTRVVIVAACVAACGAPAESTTGATGAPAEIVAPPAAHGAGDGAREGSTFANGAVANGPSIAEGLPAVTHAFTCRADAFCEDFESLDPAARWTSAVVSASDVVAFLAPSASKGARSMRVEAGASGGGAYLLLDGGPGGGERWAGAFGFALRLDAPPATRLGGPRLVATLPAGEGALGVAVTPAGFVLEQRAPGAPDSARVLTPLTAPGAWHRVVIGVESNASPSGAPPYGRVEIAIDDGDLAVDDLLVPVHAGSLELQVGVTEPDTAPAAVQIDDVMFFAR
jgi:hypothetical protein